MSGNGDGLTLLTAATVEAHLVARGLVRAGTRVVAEELGGGVSNVVLGVDAGNQRLVLKQALPRLRVADQWLAKRERALTEAAALRLLAQFSPEAIPPVLDVDESSCAIVIGRAPASWRTWKDDLLEGRVDQETGSRLGTLLAGWHGLELGGHAHLDDPEAFEQLRVDPYYRTVARRLPDLAGPIDALIERMVAARRCLVHGDFSPKNVLVGDDTLWVIDFEVAHVGDPAFDVAFLSNHLVLKALHRPGVRDDYAECLDDFWRSYFNGVPTGFAGTTAHVLRHLGALLVARVHGKSPAEYLTAAEATRAHALGAELLLDPPDSLDEVWARLRGLDARA